MPLSDRDMQFAVSDAAHFLKPILQSNLTSDATTAGWPANIVSALVVDFDGSNLSVKYPDELANQIDDLEYGKPFGLPNPVLRPFVYRSETYIEDVIVSRTLDLVLDMKEVF